MALDQLPDRARVDAHDKVRGTTFYAADFQLPDMLYAVLVPSPIAKGKVVRVDTAGASSVPGVLRVLNAGGGNGLADEYFGRDPEGRINGSLDVVASVKVASAGLITPAEFRFAGAELKLH